MAAQQTLEVSFEDKLNTEDDQPTARMIFGFWKYWWNRSLQKTNLP